MAVFVPSIIDVLRVVAIFLIHVIPAPGEVVSGDLCDFSLYGKPDYSSCVALLYGSPLHRGAGIFNIDNDEHGFLLPYFGGRASFTVNQWRHRVTLPKVWASAACKVALLVEPAPTGGFTTDSGSWGEIATRGKALLDNCTFTRAKAERAGGVGHAGTNGKLSIVIYQWASAFDLAITSGIRPGSLARVHENGTMINPSVGGRIEKP